MFAVFITALGVESKAVLDGFSDVRRRVHPNGTIYHTGYLRSNLSLEVGHVEIGMGVERTAQHVERAVEYFAPQAVLFVGVAGGLKDCQIGDIVVANKTYQYEYGVDGRSFKPRPQTSGPDHLMEQLARSCAHDHPMTVLIGAVATGSKVLHSKLSSAATLIRESYSDALAVDMEGHSLYAAAASLPGVHSLVVRGISDLLDDKAASDSAGSQSLASRAAAGFAFRIVEELAVALTFPGPTIAPNRLPADTARVIGRERELGVLGSGLAAGVNLISVTAWAGAGKTALVSYWYRGLREAPLPAGSHLFTWSFYSQGSNRVGSASSDEFFIAFLEHAGVPDAGKMSPWRRVEVALGFCRRRFVVLVLDGLEPLQVAGDLDAGHILDGPLRTFLVELAGECQGMTVVTSRLPLSDAVVGDRHVSLDLQRLPTRAAVEVLRYYGLHGDDDRLAAMALAVGGHCFSLRLVARFFAVSGASPSSLDSAAHALHALSQPSAKIDRMLSWYERILAGTPQRDVLLSLGLFDRPAPLLALCAVHASPCVNALNQATANLSCAQIEHAAKELQQLGLAQVLDGDSDTIVDAHPLVREASSRRLQSADVDAWREAHARLFLHFNAAVPRPARTASELTILYRASRHGVAAGRPQEVIAAVLRAKVQQGDNSFASKILQVANADLAALAPFFTPDWGRVALPLPEEDAMWLMGHAIYDLRVLGRIPQALELSLSLLSRLRAVQDRPREAVVAANTAHLSLLAGFVGDALQLSRRAVAAAEDLPTESPARVAARRSLSNALLHAGRISDAAALAHQDEAVGNEVRAAYPAFLSPVGFRYGLLLIAMAEMEILSGNAERVRNQLPDAVERFSQAASWAEESHGYLLAQGLALLVLARLTSLLVQAGGLSAVDPRDLVDDAAGRLRSAATQDLVVCSLLHGARIHCDAGDAREADHRVEMAASMAQRFALPLYSVSALVEKGVCLTASGRPHDAEDRWREAERRAETLAFGLELRRIGLLRRFHEPSR